MIRRQFLRMVGSIPIGGDGLRNMTLSADGPSNRFLTPRAVEEETGPEVEWQQTYGGDKDSEIRSVLETSSGDYLFTGTKASNRNNGTNVWVAKVDSGGGLQWEETYGGYGYDEGKSVIETKEGNYLVCGKKRLDATRRDPLHGQDAGWLIAVGSDGAIKWEQVYSDSHELRSLIGVENETYLIAGESTSSIEKPTWLGKIRSDGSVLWEEDYGGRVHSICNITDGGYLIAGQKRVDDVFDAWLTSITRNGAVQWEETYGRQNDDVAKSVIETSNGDYLFAGTLSTSDMTDKEGWLVQIDTNGSKQWEQAFGGRGDDMAKSVIGTNNDGYLLAGESGIAAHSPWLVKTGPRGSKQWAQTFEEVNGGVIFSVIETIDSGYLFTDESRLVKLEGSEESTSRDQSGTASYEIADGADLQSIRHDLAGEYELVADIDVSNVEDFEPLGDDKAPFTGTFEGNEHVISNVSINQKNEDNLGLFGAVQGGTIRNVTVSDAVVSGDVRVGGLVGEATNSSIINSAVEGEVEGRLSVGGLVGSSEGESVIKNSRSSASVLGEERVGTGLIGGLVGFNGSTIRNSHSTSDVVGNGNQVGGLVGENSGSIEQSYSTSGVMGANLTGGLVGGHYDEAIINDSYASGDVQGKATDDVEDPNQVGGLVGKSHSSTISSSYATGSVSSTGAGIGGLVGVAEKGTIRETYATGAVTGKGTLAGGDGGGDGTPQSEGLAAVRLPEEVEAGQEFTINNEPLTDLFEEADRWVLEGETDLNHATWEVQLLDPEGDVINVVSYNGATFRHTLARGDGVREVVVSVTGEVPEGSGMGMMLNRGVRDGSSQDDVGGLVGSVAGTSLSTIEASYWDVTTTGQESSPEVSDAHGLTTDQMTGAAARDHMDGFDFEATWQTTESYPVLAWQETTAGFDPAVHGFGFSNHEITADHGPVGILDTPSDVRDDVMQTLSEEISAHDMVVNQVYVSAISSIIVNLLNNLALVVGHCHGMAVTADRFYRNPRTVPADTTAAITDPATVHDRIDENHRTQITNNDTLLSLITMRWASGQLNLADELAETVNQIDEQGPTPVILYGDIIAPHICLAYDYNQSGESTTLKIYDPNYPASRYGGRELTLTVDTSGETATVTEPLQTVKSDSTVEELHLLTPARIQPTNVQEVFDELGTIMTLSLHSPAELEVIDPDGNRLESPQQISSDFVYSVGAKPGEYDINVIGTGSGEYTLDIQAVHVDGVVSDETRTGDIAPGEAQSYSVTIPETPGQSNGTTSEPSGFPSWVPYAGVSGAVLGGGALLYRYLRSDEDSTTNASEINQWTRENEGRFGDDQAQSHEESVSKGEESISGRSGSDQKANDGVYCIQCGAANSADSNYCMECGEPLM